MAQFLAYCESQSALAKTEIDRLRKRQAGFDHMVERIEGYVLRVILHQEPDAKGKYPKLEGNTSSFGAQDRPSVYTDSVPGAAIAAGEFRLVRK